MKWILAPAAMLTTLTLISCATQAAEVSVEKTDKGVVIKIDGEMFTEYITDFAGTPICWPIIGPSGKKMTRNFPMAEGPDSEKKDHPHHRSLWFTHGEVSGRHDFWASGKDEVRHQEFKQIEADGEKAVVVTTNAWVAKASGKVLCEDERTLVFGVDGEARYIDFDITIRALDEPVTFEDTKEGTFGVRVPGTMKVDAVKSDPSWGGHIVSSEGLRDGETWGKRASWVTYYGPVEQETLGITIMNHPTSFRYPTWWHVRTYGLFAANPFGLSYFDGPSENGTVAIAPGESITLRYRVLFHPGDAEQADIASRFAEYAKSPK